MSIFQQIKTGLITGSLCTIPFLAPAAIPVPGEDVSNISCQVVWPVDGNLVTYLDHLVTMGVDTARCDMMWWGLVEIEKGIYDWDGSRYPGWTGWNVDRMMGLMRDRNIEPYVVLGLGNAVYNPAPNGVDWVSPNTAESRTAFANYCAEAAKRYKDDVHYWEIWNEPNTDLFWGGTPSPADYTALVAQASPAVRANDPDALIIGGVMAGTGVSYLASCFDEGLLDYIDVVSIHPYRTSAPETIANEVQTIRNNIASHTSRDIKIWTGEWGYNTYFSEVGLIGHGKSLARMMVNNLTLDIEMSTWFSIHAFTEIGDGIDDEWGLLTRSLQPRPSYYAMQTMNQYLNEPIKYVNNPFSATLSGASSRTRVETFEQTPGENFTIAVWSEAWPTSENMNTTNRTLTLNTGDKIISSFKVANSLNGDLYTSVTLTDLGDGSYQFLNYPYGDFPTLLVLELAQAPTASTSWTLQ